MNGGQNKEDCVLFIGLSAAQGECLHTAAGDDDGSVRQKHLIVKRTVMSVTLFPSQRRFDEVPRREGFPMRLMALLTALALVGLLTGSQACAEEMLAWGWDGCLR